MAPTKHVRFLNEPNGDWDGPLKETEMAPKRLKKSVKFVHNPTEEAKKENKKNLETFICAVKVAKNYFGNPSPPFDVPSSVLYNYVISLFDDFPNEVLEGQKTAKWKSSSLKKARVEITINGAKIIHPVFSSLTYLFIKLWVDGRRPKFTSIKDHRAAMNWNESFKLNVRNWYVDAIHFELWIAKTPQVFKSAKSSRKRICQSACQRLRIFCPWAFITDFSEQGKNKGCLFMRKWNPFKKTQLDYVFFVGGVSEMIAQLPNLKENIVFKLSNESIPEMNLDAEINIMAGIAIKAACKCDKHIKLHCLLLCYCYDNILNTEKEFCFWKNWEDILPPEALTLVHQHALQHALTITEQTLSSWLLLTILKMNGESRISYSLLKQLLESLYVHALEQPLKTNLRIVYRKVIEEFRLFATSELSRLHEAFTWETKEEISELYDFLKCLHFVDTKGISDKYEFYEDILKEEYKIYFYDLCVGKSDKLNDKLSAKVNLEGLKCILFSLLNNQIYLDDLFRKTWNKNYTLTVCTYLDRAITRFIKPAIAHLEEKSREESRYLGQMESFKLLQIYHCIRNLVDYINERIPGNKKNLYMESYRNWFSEEIIASWFLISIKYTKSFIAISINKDSMEPLDFQIRYSTSAKDMIAIIDEMVTLTWLQLTWEQQLYTHTALNEAIYNCSVYYFEAMEKHCTKANFFTQNKFFHINKKMCVALSSVYIVFEYLHKIWVKIQEVIIKAQNAYGFALVDTSDILRNTLLLKMPQLFIYVIEKFKETLQELITNVMNKKKGRSRKHWAAVICDYIEMFLRTAYLNLQVIPFVVFLRSLWYATVDSLSDKLFFIPLLCFESQTKLCKNIDVILTMVGKVFYSNGKGLTYYEMENNRYRELKYNLGQYLTPK